MSNSPLVSYTKLSPNHSGQRTHAIDRITPHCVVGQCSVETLGNIFAPTSRQASCQYGIGVDGRVGMYVEEKNRSWCSSSNENDQRAVTIECASDTTHPYAFKDVVYNKLIELCVDICKRNGKKKLLWLHMLSTAAFNALLKTLEEPPAHVIFILATTEIQKVPATILSRCQRYDFTRIGPEDIARRVEYIAGEEKLELTSDGAELIARLADGALRDALSILDTCAGVTAKIDADVVRRMAGVTDRSYLFHISDALEAQDAAAALAQLAQLRQQSVDVKRLTEELIAHYRALMLAALPGGQALLSGVSPEEEALYLQKGPEMGQREAIRAIRTLGTALEHMTRGSDQRIELELALFSLSEPPQQMQAVAVQAAPVRAAQPEAPRPFAAAVQPFASAPVQPAPAAAAPQTPAAGAEPAPAVQQTSPQPAAPEAPPAPAEELPPMPDEPPVQQSDAALPWDEPAPQAPPPEEPVSQPEQPAPVEQPPAAEEPPAPVQEHPADPVLTKPRSVAQQGTNPFPYWGQIVQKLEGIDPMLYMYLRKSKAYFDGTRVLIDGGKTFRDFIRVNKDSQKLIKKLIAEVSGVPVPIGPYEPKTAGKTSSNAEQSLLALEKLGLEVSIEDTARKKR